jgi:hypothetical protein
MRMASRHALPQLNIVVYPKTVMHQLSSWIAHYNEVHPHKLSDIVHPVSSFGLTVSARSGATTG